MSHYCILEKLGGGGMGVRSSSLSARGTGRFGLEPREHCTIYEIDEQDAKAFIAMEFLEGETLKEAIAGRRPMEL